MVICLKQGANDLHMPMPSHHLLLHKNPEWFAFLVPATQVVLENRQLNGCKSVLTYNLSGCTAYVVFTATVQCRRAGDLVVVGAVRRSCG